MAVEINQNTSIKITLSCIQKRIDLPIAEPNLVDNFNYTALKDSLVNGSGTDAANLLYHQTRTILDGTMDIFNLDALSEDSWGRILNYDAIKALVIYNKPLPPNLLGYLVVRFKNEVWNIGPNGFRVLWEPFQTGVQGLVSSQSTEEGELTVEAIGSDRVYDIVIIGSDKEVSSSSGQ